ncbi:response regulator transcription factor [Paraburkholderia sp. EG304]|uniref:response regulator transcription factor n=1 Tax=Paraburkholderia sp. EG304 TaxID=3237015 RepID=UPI00397E6CAE
MNCNDGLDGIVPIVLVSAQGDMQTAVEAMKAGAVDFLVKPVEAALLLEATARATAQAQRLFARREQRAEVQRRLDTLTPREREVMALVVAGHMNKLVASELGAAEKTVKVHRGRVMEKMKAASLAGLVSMLIDSDFDTPELRP